MTKLDYVHGHNYLCFFGCFPLFGTGLDGGVLSLFFEVFLESGSCPFLSNDYFLFLANTKLSN